MNDKLRNNSLGIIRTTTCGVAATLLTVMFSWSFVASTSHIGWLGSDAVVASPTIAAVDARGPAATWT